MKAFLYRQKSQRLKLSRKPLHIGVIGWVTPANSYSLFFVCIFISFTKLPEFIANNTTILFSPMLQYSCIPRMATSRTPEPQKATASDFSHPFYIHTSISSIHSPQEDVSKTWKLGARTLDLSVSLRNTKNFTTEQPRIKVVANSLSMITAHCSTNHWRGIICLCRMSQPPWRTTQLQKSLEYEFKNIMGIFLCYPWAT